MPQRSVAIPEFVALPQYHALRDLLFDFEFSLVSCVFWQNKAPWELEERTCPDSFLLIPLLGELDIFLGSRRYSVPPGRFLMLPEGTRHRARLKKGFRRLEQISIHCRIQDRWGRSLLGRFASQVGSFPNRRDFALRLKELSALMSRDPEIGRLYGETVLKEILVSQIRQGAILLPASDADSRVGTVIQRMEKEFPSVDLSIDDLARSMEITAVQLRKLFRRATGSSPKQFLSALRFRKAAGMLRHSVSAVKKIAAECGFASDHYFHLAFRREFGCTPSEYRRKTSAEV